MRAALGEQAQLYRARLREDTTSSAACRRSASVAASASACSGRAELGQEGRAHGGDHERVLGDTAPLTKVDPLPAGDEGGVRPLVLPADDGEVVVLDGGCSAVPLLDCERERLAHMPEPFALAQVAAGCAPVAGAGRLRGRKGGRAVRWWRRRGRAVAAIMSANGKATK